MISHSSQKQGILLYVINQNTRAIQKGDLNLTPSNTDLFDLISDYKLQKLLSRPTCFKSENPPCIDIFVPTSKSYFMKTLTFKTGILIITIQLELCLDQRLLKVNEILFSVVATRILIISNLKKYENKNCYLGQTLTSFTQFLNLLQINLLL